MASPNWWQLTDPRGLIQDDARWMEQNKDPRAYYPGSQGPPAVFTRPPPREPPRYAPQPPPQAPAAPAPAAPAPQQMAAATPPPSLLDLLGAIKNPANPGAGPADARSGYGPIPSLGGGDPKGRDALRRQMMMAQMGMNMAGGGGGMVDIEGRWTS